MSNNVGKILTERGLVDLLAAVRAEVGVLRGAEEAGTGLQLDANFAAKRRDLF